jgi:hypothetical protein
MKRQSNPAAPEPEGERPIKVGYRVRTKTGKYGAVLIAAGNDIAPLHCQLQMESGYGGLDRAWVLAECLEVVSSGSNPA